MQYLECLGRYNFFIMFDAEKNCEIYFYDVVIIAAKAFERNAIF